MLQKWFKFKIGKDRPKAPDYAECKRILLKEYSTKENQTSELSGACHRKFSITYRRTRITTFDVLLPGIPKRPFKQT